MVPTKIVLNTGALVFNQFPRQRLFESRPRQFDFELQLLDCGILTGPDVNEQSSKHRRPSHGTNIGGSPSATSAPSPMAGLAGQCPEGAETGLALGVAFGVGGYGADTGMTVPGIPCRDKLLVSCNRIVK
jgi:hypothetical protein